MVGSKHLIADIGDLVVFHYCIGNIAILLQ